MKNGKISQSRLTQRGHWGSLPQTYVFWWKPVRDKRKRRKRVSSTSQQIRLKNSGFETKIRKVAIIYRNSKGQHHWSGWNEISIRVTEEGAWNIIRNV